MNSGINWEDVGETGKVISVRVDKDSGEKIDQIAKEYNLTRGSVVRKIVRYYFKEMEKGE